jgi:threonine dehydratase
MMESLTATKPFGSSHQPANTPAIDEHGRITLPGFPSGMAVESYLPLVHQYAKILEASRILDRHRNHLRQYEPIDPNPGQAPLTPLVPSRLNPHLFYKREDKTITRAYKVRGAVVGMAKMMDSLGVRRFITVSTGNHAMGVLKSAELLRTDSVRVVVPTNAAPLKLERLEAVLKTLQQKNVKADLIQVGQTFDEAREWAMSQTDGVDGEPEAYLDPYGDPWVVAGQGTLGLELLYQIGQVLTEAERDGRPYEEVVVISPVGGGGLLTGTATALKMASSWEPAFRNVSLRFLGLRLASLDSELGDAIKVAKVADFNEACLQALGVPLRPLTDAEMRQGMDFVHADLGDRVEGASGGAVSPALVDAFNYPTAKRLVVSIISGGNTAH